MRNSILGIALPAFALACSSASGASPSPSSPRDSGVVESDPPPPVEAGPDPIGDPTACDLDRGVTCGLCCGTTFPDGVQFYELAQQDCVCSGMGSCASSCSYSDCVALHSADPTCDACLQAAVARCETPVRATCQGDPYCKTYLTCTSRCMP